MIIIIIMIIIAEMMHIAPCWSGGHIVSLTVGLKLGLDQNLRCQLQISAASFEQFLFTW